MSRLVGRVHFNATLDGKSIPADAERAGRQAGLAGGKAFGDEWDKEFRKTLTSQGQRQLTHWNKRGHADGLAYGRGLELEFEKFSSRLGRAFDNFQGLSVSSDFMDDFVGKSGDMDRAISQLTDDLELLQRQGTISDTQFRNSTDAVERYRVKMGTVSDEIRQLLDAEGAHTKSIAEMNREWRFSEKLAREVSEGYERVINSQVNLLPNWKNMSHEARQWTLIIGAITAAIPELAGLSSAAGSGLLALGGAATSAGIGVGATISAIVGLNKDIKELPASLLPARAGLDDFKSSFSDLNSVITERAFADSEQAWRSLGSTVRGLSPAFGVVGDSIGTILDELADGLAPGTRNFENLVTVVEGSADDFEQLAGSVGRLGEGLLSAFANPEMQRSVDELLGWIDELVDGFASFAEGDSFDDFLRHGRAVFGELGELLGTTGGLLDDLVTPESITRLTTFMDQIGVFLDTGGRGILEFADQLNAFGVISELLATVGTALEPIREPIADIGEELNRLLTSGVIEGIGRGLDAIVFVTGPLVGGFAEILENIPDEALIVLAQAATIAAGGFVTLKGVQGLQGVSSLLSGVKRDGSGAATALSQVGAMASVAAAGVAGLTALNQASQDFFEGIREYDSNTQDVLDGNMSLRDSWDLLGGSVLGTKLNMDIMSESLDQVQNIGGDLDQFFPSLAAQFTEAGRQAGGLAEVLTTLSPALANLANVDVQAATTQFSSWVDELGATDQQVLNMLEKMPEFRDVLEAVALQVDGTATDQDILNLALGRGADATDTNTEALDGMRESASLTEAQVDTLAEKIRGFGDDTLSARDAEREFQQAVDDLTDSYELNGSTLDITTEKGRANEKALDDLAKATLDAAASKLELTGSEEDAAAAVEAGRQALIDQLAQFGIVGQAAEDYADNLGLIPDDILTELTLSGVASSQQAIDSFISRNNGRTLTVYQRMVQGALVGAGTGAGAPRTAIGGIFDGAQTRVIAEAGPEAVVPLNRPLDQVDPDVRWLSAIAQGKGDKMSGGVNSGPSKKVDVHPGAIVVGGGPNPVRTGVEVLEQLAQNM